MRFDTFNLTETQMALLESSDQGGNRCAVFRLEGKVDKERLATAVQRVIAQCPPFRYRVEQIDGHPRILLTKEAAAAAPERDQPGLQIIATDGGEAAAFALIENMLNRRLRLNSGTPYLFALVQGAKAAYLVFVCHPLILDRFSLRPLFRALSAAWRGETLPDDLALPQPLLLSEEAARTADPDRYGESLRFWTGLLRDTAFEWRPPPLEAHLDDSLFSLTLSYQARDRMSRLATDLGIGLDHLLVFAFHLFLFRLTRSENVLTAYRHRVRTGAPEQIGFNENVAFFRSLLVGDLTGDQAGHQTGEQTLGSFLRRAARLFMQASHFSDMPMREVLRELQRADPDFKPTNVLFDEDPLPHGELVLEGLTVTLLSSLSHQWESEDIAIYFDLRDTLELNVLARAPQDLPGLKMALAHFLVLLEHLPDELDRPLTTTMLFTETLRQQAVGLAQSQPPVVRAEDVLNHFLATCNQQPEAPALRFGERVLSYQALAQAAGAVAAGLDALDIEAREPLIGLCLERSERMIAAIFGVLGADAGYVPLDPSMPAERLGFIAADAGLGAVITDAATRATIAPPDGDPIVDCPVLDIDQLLATPPRDLTPAAPESLGQIAYVIYTSGTTGTPKGVAIERGMLAHFIAALEGIWDRGPGTRWMQFASVNFDASVLEIFNPLTHGGELVVVPSSARTDALAIEALMREQRVTHAFLPPALLRLLPRRPLPDLIAIFSGGEAADEDTVHFWSKTVELANIYGPTETTVMATINRMGGDKAANNLGHPLRGYDTYLLDERGQLSPLGGVGEICIGGAAVARGYLGRPELTAKKFIPNPFGPGRLYRTGDLGRYRPDGELEFLGRSDFQVKVRGFRIELGDIEHAIAEQPEISGVYVGAFEVQGSKALIAWYVSTELKPDALRTRLEAKLQRYMVPSYLIPLEAFPLNISGKIDRTRLPMPGADDATVAASQDVDALEHLVRETWSKALGVAPAKFAPDSHFFHLGGHSLLVVQVCLHLSEALGSNIRPKQLFEHPLLGEFCDLLRGAPAGANANPLPPLVATGKTRAPVLNRLIGLIQSRALRLPEDNTYNIVVRIDFSAEINPLQLRTATTELLAAHPVFRACFAEQDGQLYIQIPEPAAKDDQPLVALHDSSNEGIHARTETLRHQPLGIDSAPLWRAELHVSTAGTCSLVFCIHHAIFDGWSFNLFLDELGERYLRHPVPERLNIFDYCDWSRCLPKSPPFAESIAYWKHKLGGADAHTELPIDQNPGNPNESPDTNQALALRFAPETVAALKAFADEAGITMSPLLFALYLVWIWRLTGQRELVCAYPYAGRDIAGTEHIYGMFVTMGFLRQTLDPRASFGELATAVHRQMLDDKDHLLATPYDAEIAGLESLNLIFSLQSGIGLEGSFGEVGFKADELPAATAKADLTGIFYQSLDGAIEGRLEYDSSRFHPETVSGFLDTYQSLVEAAARAPQSRVNELAYQSDADLSRFMGFACGPRLELPPSTIPARFASVAARAPEAPAVLFEGRSLSYQALAELSDRIASGLLRRLAPGSRVGLSMHKSDTLVATLLGILKAGCAYVPLDPSYPPERLRFFAENAGVTHVAADAPSREALTEIGLGGLRFFDPDQDLAPSAGEQPKVGPETLAYIIHTSGSTGQPKGVMIEQHNLVHFAVSAAAAMQLEAGSVVALIASMNFDASVLEIFPALLNGHTLAVVPEDARKEPALLHRTIGELGVTHTIMSPVVLRNLPHEPLPALRMLGFGGDVIDQQTADWWSRQTRFLSMYGPTETTVMASLGEIAPGANARIIGRPLPGYRLYLLDRDHQPVPQGAVGEICIGGEGLARGYLNRDDLTVERFVLDPFGGSPYARMYLTGDLGRFLPDGTIEFFGRNDAQIKVRGFRIELGEIENSLASFPGIKQVVCAAKGEGENRYLAAYYLADSDLCESALRKHAGEFLPDYMIPSFFVRLSALPVSPSGKIDRKALPAVAGKESQNPPQEGAERQIADIWEDLLHYHGIDRDDSFFNVGGNSLLAVRMQAAVEKKLGLEFSISDFYRAPTIAALAAGQQQDFIAQAVADAEAELLVAEPAQHPQDPMAAPQSILLTGARGFLGIFLLAELTRRCEHVHCLLRCDNKAAGLAALRKQAAEAGVDPDFARVIIVPGDLGEPGLGLSDEAHARLASDIDAILHCGAFVHHLYSYATMKPINVGGTEALLALALSGRQKPFCYVSTITVGASLTDVDRIAEDVLPNAPAVDNGYILTKWVGEQRIARAVRKFGLPAVIARPGNITGSSASGYSNYHNNHFWRFTKGCLQLGAYPDIPMPIEMMPVDHLAAAIAALATRAPEPPESQSRLLVANLANPTSLSLGDFFAQLSAAGYPAQAEPATAWQKRLSHLAPDNALSQIKDFYTGDLSGEAPPTEQQQTLAALQAAGASLDADYDALIPLYASYLERSGWIVRSGAD
ncbi:non-ribosomal peptide synthetase [Thiorhodovibrio frisius]|uniref:Amino acid adenylation enzyme/thioester reductase family protein n=1 Tax=Thiorhodovibrio frisius TaxID=631362 RepID=H8Z4Y2_9GAMM|nr:non-ribosomal peptide synthetase [Thiorhodovibrio frisius]EIC20389.1 amino acid adenylation enzyme/thioester reductase family protein [Thiorhodovibrio frisius]WPL21131.1 Linear gramicidin synthase subunit D [Thiorhodovibrio frisius]